MRNQLRPLFDRVVIKELDPDRVRRSGLLVPPGTDEPPPQHGIVLAVGPGLDWWDHVGVVMPVRPGDHVVFPASAGAWVEVDEERLLVCRVGELLGVLERVEDCPACGGRPLEPGESCPVCGREGSVSRAADLGGRAPVRSIWAVRPGAAIDRGGWPGPVIDRRESDLGGRFLDDQCGAVGDENMSSMASVATRLT